MVIPCLVVVVCGASGCPAYGVAVLFSSLIFLTRTQASDYNKKEPLTTVSDSCLVEHSPQHSNLKHLHE